MKRLIAAVSFLLLIVFTNSFAQTTNATLGGTVSDSTGALIPGVTVTATNRQTGIVTTGLTNERVHTISRHCKPASTKSRFWCKCG